MSVVALFVLAKLRPFLLRHVKEVCVVVVPIFH
jgi:hypothetical protein